MTQSSFNKRKIAGLYQELPESKWKFIEKAEGSGKEAIELRTQLRKDYNWVKKSNHIVSNLSIC